MPRTRRNKLVSLTKTPKRNTRSAKANHIDVIQEAAAKYPTCVVFLMANQRNVHLQEVRSLWKENSRMFVGKNRVLAKALGHDQGSEARAGLSAISKLLEGPVGVLFTTSSPKEVQEWFDDYSRDDFARAGNVATHDLILEPGPVMLHLDPPEPLPHSLEPQLRALGMPTELKRGVPTLIERFVVCKSGEKLTPEKAQILKHLLIKDAKFRLIPIAHWTEEAGEVAEYPLSVADEALVRQSRRSEGKPKDSKPVQRRTPKTAVDTAMADEDDEDDDEELDEDDDEDALEARERGMMMPTII